MKKIKKQNELIKRLLNCKIYLSYFDDKIYILDDGVNSSTNFHKDVSGE